MSLLYHFGVMQRLVQAMAIVMQRTMGTSGAESLSTAANIFVGPTEAPLVIRPYLHELTESELMAVMVGGFATVAGGVMAAYVQMGIDAGHLATASVISAPAALTDLQGHAARSGPAADARAERSSMFISPPSTCSRPSRWARPTG